jgi:hypothetical protein
MRELEVVADAIFAALVDGGVVVHTRTKRYYSLNLTGARIWGLLEDSGDPALAATTIAAEYGISDEQATQAIAQLTEGLTAAGLMRRATSA